MAPKCSHVGCWEYTRDRSGLCAQHRKPMTDIAAIVAGLSELEKALILSTSERWGSWMWGVSGDLVRKGLFKQTSETERVHSELGLQVRAAILGER